MYSKSNNLENINRKINSKKFEIPKFFLVKKKDFYKKNLFTKIQSNFFNKKIILRSSAFNEDKFENSAAGKYDSFIINKLDKDKIRKSILLMSKKLKHNKDKVIVQEYIENPDIAGVVFSCDINNGSPYYIINFDKSGKTNLITSGKKNSSMQTLNIYKHQKINGKFKKLIQIVKYFEKIFKDNVLDIEFAIKKNKIYIFQCRNLKKIKKQKINYLKDNLINIEKKILKLKNKNPYLTGRTTYFSNMSDWNPAEMIGNNPKPLAISLYKELITNSIWAEQRSNYGYKNVKPNHLLINLGGSPYIDLRTDINSFLPAELDRKIQEKLTNFFLKKLNNKKFLHDKIEFDVVPTTFEPDLNKKTENILNNTEIKDYKKSLKILTNKFFENENKILNTELNKIYQLDEIINKFNKSNLSEIQKIFFLIQECKQKGTLPFAGLARCAFVGNSILRIFVKKDILKKKDYSDLYESFFNIPKLINTELLKIKSGSNKKKFLKDFGHLRPLTYSINTKNYKENFRKYFGDLKELKNKKKVKFKVSKNVEKRINLFFKKNGIKTTAKSFFDFTKKSTQLREYSKLIFTKCINEIFINLIKLGKEINISRNDLEFISINQFLQSYSNLSNSKLKKILKKEIFENKKNHKILKQIKLPDFIESHKDLYSFLDNSSNGNFITEKKINSKLVEFKFGKSLKKIKNNIIMIENADPGFDFIFSYNIKGLITKYGGPNSHMAIRCMELGIPAVIGLGEIKYKNLLESHTIELNCSEQKINILN